MDALLEGGIWSVKRAPADRAKGSDRIATVAVKCTDALKTSPPRFAVQMLLDRRSRIGAVKYHGEELSPGQVHGFEKRDAAEGCFIRANIDAPLKPGENAVRKTASNMYNDFFISNLISCGQYFVSIFRLCESVASHQPAKHKQLFCHYNNRPLPEGKGRGPGQTSCALLSPASYLGLGMSISVSKNPNIANR